MGDSLEMMEADAGCHEIHDDTLESIRGHKYGKKMGMVTSTEEIDEPEGHYNTIQE